MADENEPCATCDGAGCPVCREEWREEPVPKKPEFIDPATGVECTHGVTFDEEAAKGLDTQEIRKRWPRGWGPCSLGCGFSGIAYASSAHFIYGDW